MGYQFSRHASLASYNPYQLLYGREPILLSFIRKKLAFVLDLGVDAWLSGPIPVHTFFFKAHTPEILRPHPPNARHPNCFLIHLSMMDFQTPWRACIRAVGWPLIVWTTTTRVKGALPPFGPCGVSSLPGALSHAGAMAACHCFVAFIVLSGAPGCSVSVLSL